MGLVCGMVCPVGVMARIAARTALASLALGVAACSTGAPASDSSGTVVDWYAVPGRSNETALATTCAAASDGAYTVQLHWLPPTIDNRHTELVRRLSGANSSVDVISLDTALIAEMSDAGFLAPLSATQQATWGEGVAPGALAASTRDDDLVAAPWWFDPQLLWFRGATAERAGLDTTAPISWDDLIAGADRLGVSIQIDDVDGTGTSEWVAALVTAGGGTLVSGAGGATKVGLDSVAGRSAASVVEFYRESRVGPGPSADATTTFADVGGGFLLAPSSALSTAPLQIISPELGFVPYPVITDAAPAPGSGTSLAVARDAKDKSASADLIECLTAPDQQRSLILATGHGAARTATYDDKAVQRDSPTAAIVQTALETAQPAPPTASWTAIRRTIDQTWSPVSGVTTDTTPQASQREAEAAVAGELP